MGWLHKVAKRLFASRVQPEAKFVLSFDGAEIRLSDPDGAIRAIKTADIGSIIIETNDTGPIGMDVWWVLLDRNEKLGVLYPQGATGEGAVLKWLMALPGFDHEVMIKAMSSTANATYPVWRKNNLT